MILGIVYLTENQDPLPVSKPCEYKSSLQVWETSLGPLFEENYVAERTHESNPELSEESVNHEFSFNGLLINLIEKIFSNCYYRNDADFQDVLESTDESISLLGVNCTYRMISYNHSLLELVSLKEKSELTSFEKDCLNNMVEGHNACLMFYPCLGQENSGDVVKVLMINSLKYLFVLKYIFHDLLTSIECEKQSKSVVAVSLWGVNVKDNSKNVSNDSSLSMKGVDLFDLVDAFPELKRRKGTCFDHLFFTKNEMKEEKMMTCTEVITSSFYDVIKLWGKALQVLEEQLELKFCQRSDQCLYITGSISIERYNSASGEYWSEYGTTLISFPDFLSTGCTENRASEFVIGLVEDSLQNCNIVDENGLKVIVEECKENPFGQRVADRLLAEADSRLKTSCFLPSALSDTRVQNISGMPLSHLRYLIAPIFAGNSVTAFVTLLEEKYFNVAVEKGTGDCVLQSIEWLFRHKEWLTRMLELSNKLNNVITSCAFSGKVWRPHFASKDEPPGRAVSENVGGHWSHENSAGDDFAIYLENAMDDTFECASFANSEALVSKDESDCIPADLNTSRPRNVEELEVFEGIVKICRQVVREYKGYKNTTEKRFERLKKQLTSSEEVIARQELKIEYLEDEHELMVSRLKKIVAELESHVDVSQYMSDADGSKSVKRLLNSFKDVILIFKSALEHRQLSEQFWREQAMQNAYCKVSSPEVDALPIF